MKKLKKVVKKLKKVVKKLRNGKEVEEQIRINIDDENSETIELDEEGYLRKWK